LNEVTFPESSETEISTDGDSMANPKIISCP